MKIRRVVARTIADGVTGELYSGRVTAVNGSITQVEKGVFEPQAGDIVLAENKLLAPAFIDAHGHSDLSLMGSRYINPCGNVFIFLIECIPI